MDNTRTADLYRAIEEDVAGHLGAAADLYEQVIAEKDTLRDAFVNLAVLCWDCIDPGFPLISLEFFDRCAQRYSEVLTEAGRRFSDDCEIRFWSLYCDFITLGNPEFREECEAIVASPCCDSLVPYFYLYGFTGGTDLQDYQRRLADGDEFRPQADLLLAECRLLPTTKNRYIQSVLEASIHRKHGR